MNAGEEVAFRSGGGGEGTLGSSTASVSPDVVGVGGGVNEWRAGGKWRGIEVAEWHLARERRLSSASVM